MLSSSLTPHPLPTLYAGERTGPLKLLGEALEEIVPVATVLHRTYLEMCINSKVG